MFQSVLRFARVWLALLIGLTSSPAADWPQWGEGPIRNPVGFEKGAPLDFQLPVTEDGKQARNVAWTAELGDRTVIPPVIADGLIWVGTNARWPGNDKIPTKDWDGVLMCFRESDGKLLWKHRTPRLSGKGVEWEEDFPRSALGSVPLVEGDRLWYLNNRTEVVCFDIAPLKKGTGEPRELWKRDLRKEFGVFPHLPLMQRGFGASVGGHKDRLYLVTHDGVDDTHLKVPAPDAPSLVCLENATGKVVWKDNSPGKNILEHQVSSPLVIEVNGKAQVTVGQGDGWLRSFDAATGKLILGAADAKEWKPIAEFAPSRPDKGQPAWTFPVVANGYLYVRDYNTLLRYDVRDPGRLRKKVPDAVFVPTPPDVVTRMLELANVKKGDVLDDLGSGDGRIVIAAAKGYGCQAVGVELDKELVAKSRKHATEARVEKLVRFEEGDLFETDFSGATVIALYILPSMSQKLLPKFDKLKAGTRIVSHCFVIPGLKPDKVIKVTSEEDDVERPIFLYTVSLTRKKPGER